MTGTDASSLTLRFPPVIEFGWGAQARVPGVLADLFGDSATPRVLLVSTRTVAGFPEDAHAALCGSPPVATYSGVPHDPPLEVVEELRTLATENRAEAVLAAGGGSVMDAAKAAAALAGAAGSVADYFYGKRQQLRPGLPMIALPTTAGSGAELTRNAVLSDPGNLLKKSLRLRWMVPKAAVSDPELTLSAPPALTAASGMDALTQAVEAYISLRANAVSRGLAAEGVRLLLHHLCAAYQDGTDKRARTETARGSLLTAMSFSQSGLGAVHGLAHPLGISLGLPHGLVCAILLPHVLRWNAPVCEEELDTLARHAGLDSGAGLLASLRSLAQELGVPPGFPKKSLNSEVIEHVVANCRSGSMKANPRPMNDEDVRRFLVSLGTSELEGNEAPV